MGIENVEFKYESDKKISLEKILVSLHDYFKKCSDQSGEVETAFKEYFKFKEKANELEDTLEKYRKYKKKPSKKLFISSERKKIAKSLSSKTYDIVTVELLQKPTRIPLVLKEGLGYQNKTLTDGEKRAMKGWFNELNKTLCYSPKIQEKDYDDFLNNKLSNLFKKSSDIADLISKTNGKKIQNIQYDLNKISKGK
ncbi:MAG: hypothetical protein Q4B84_05280 [Clostridia bacterium]|nr:hypothetical protein [Clostridia bacterium]